MATDSVRSSLLGRLEAELEQSHDRMLDEVLNALDTRPTVSWDHHGHQQYGMVIRHNGGPMEHLRVLVKNKETGREVWLYWYAIRDSLVTDYTAKEAPNAQA